MTVSRPVIVALLAAIALASFGLAWVFLDLGRESNMRSAEKDFLTRLRTGELRSAAEKQAPKPAPSADRGENEADLASWYAEAGGEEESGRARGASN